MTAETKSGGPGQTCPGCGKPASGNFCHHCGTALGGRFCTKCGAKLSGAAKFCTQCGAPAAGAKAPAGRRGGRKGGSPVAADHRGAAAATFGGGNAPWWIAGIALFGLILVVGWNMVKPAGPSAPAGGAPAGTNPATGQSTLDLENMSPREAADRLFNRVMTSVAEGDTTGAMFFQPMAVQAYQRAEPLDLDGVLHLSLLQALGDPAAGLETANRMLEAEPDHVLGLGAAAQAAIALGDSARAAEFYQHLLDVYDVQYARELAEYDGHRTLMSEMQGDARAFLSSR